MRRLTFYYYCLGQLLLDGQANDYNFIKGSNKRIEGVDDAEEYQKLCVSYLCVCKSQHVLKKNKTIRIH